ncbi:MAG: tRNA (adenosine(37)-N6)-threonylcarbamoyltransferase complex ATPase subunit type 1 TsaE [Hyphomicrobium sp.]
MTSVPTASPPMTCALILTEADEPALRRLAQVIALKLRPGDGLLLFGDLGAGKTTFARALVRALLGDPEAEVPSPTFPLLQTYDTPRLGLAHLDLYRITDTAEAAELGIDDLLDKGAIVVEWPDRVPDLEPPDSLGIDLGEGATPATRTITLTAHGSWSERLARVDDILAFLDSQPAWATATITYLQGDASARAYARLAADGHRAILMDWPRQPDGPPIRDGLPYSRIAHLAEGVPDFCDIGRLLSEAGFSAPRILAEDHDRGLLIIEDLGDRVFGSEVAAGAPMRELWRGAIDVLVKLRRFIGLEDIATTGGNSRVLPHYDARALGIETELLVDWYWPQVKGAAVPASARTEFLALWSRVIDDIVSVPAGLVLRDYHSPNLIWLPERGAGIARVGLIDFQDAVRGHPAYDLVALLQDARLDVPAEIEAELFERYLGAVDAREPGFDRDAFCRAYAALGAQRNTKILGIFARLACRDGKPGYLRHIPRIWRYLERNLAHPQLADLRAWYDANFPPALRARVLER